MGRNLSDVSQAPIRLDITSCTKSLAIVRSAVERMATLEGFCGKDAHALTWAIDEALANVIQHGYQGRDDQPITITLCPCRSAADLQGIRVEVRDRGRQVDPATIRGRPLDEVRPGGLGVHVIQTVMDEFDYSCPPDGGMLLRMVKYIQAAPATPPKSGDQAP